ncbi:MAG: dTMP kinase [Burkholderiaceae bacterium]|nr:dTMP kinase [Burkholderiaceae bacterium]
MPRGRFVSFEGMDGAGKSTHIAWFAARLRSFGLEVLETREPGGSELAESLRALLLGSPMDDVTELLLMFAARRDHVVGVIEPALRAGRWVVCDRFTDSTRAYQGGGRHMSSERIEWLADWVHAGTWPDRTYLFDLAPEVAARRRSAARAPDRFEAETAAFFERVREVYLACSAKEASRFAVIDGTESVETIRGRLDDDLARLVATARA